jgi:AraC-like DNA-binding protein
MKNFLETVEVPEGAIAWIYLFSENHVTEVLDHWHPNVELTLICRGQARYTVAGRSFTPGQKDLVLINSGELHRCSINTEICEGITVMFPRDYFSQFTKDTKALFFRLDTAKADYGRLVEKYEELYRIFVQRDRDPYVQLKMNSLVCDIAYLLLVNFRQDEFATLLIKSEKYRKRCQDITDYVDNHFRDEVSMKTLVSKFYVSREHLVRIFKKYMGTTFKKYLTGVRTRNAYSLLVYTDLTITQIAMNCGFPDSRAFISAFRKVYGVTPGKYRSDYYQNGQEGVNEAIKILLFSRDKNPEIQ